VKSKRIQKNSISSFCTIEKIQEDVVDVPAPFVTGIVASSSSSSTDGKLAPIQSRKPEIAHDRNSFEIGGRVVTLVYFDDTIYASSSSRISSRGGWVVFWDACLEVGLRLWLCLCRYRIWSRVDHLRGAQYASHYKTTRRDYFDGSVHASLVWIARRMQWSRTCSTGSGFANTT
jgi:hypothetical protein